MFQILLWPFQLIFGLIGIVFKFIAGILGLVFGLIGGIFGFVGGLLGMIFGGVFFALVVVGFIVLIRFLFNMHRRA